MHADVKYSTLNAFLDNISNHNYSWFQISNNFKFLVMFLRITKFYSKYVILWINYEKWTHDIDLKQNATNVHRMLSNFSFFRFFLKLNAIQKSGESSCCNG